MLLKGPIRWYGIMLWRRFRWLSIYTLLIQAISTTLMNVVIPLVIVQLILHLKNDDGVSGDVRLILIMTLIVGVAEVVLLALKQTLNWDGRRYLIHQVMDIMKTSRLRFKDTASKGELTSSLNDYINSFREVVGAVFTQLPMITVSMAGMVWVLFRSGIVWLGWFSIGFSIIIPWVMHKTGTKLRAKVKVSAKAERVEMGCLASMKTNHRMQWFLPILDQEGREAGKKAHSLRQQTSRVVWRRWLEVQAFKSVLVLLGLIAVLSVREQGTASAVLLITILAANLVMIYQITDVFSNAQSKAEPFTDLLDNAETRHPLPAPQRMEIYISQVQVVYPVLSPGGAMSFNQVNIATERPIVLRPGINCLTPQTGKGKSTLLDLLSGALTDYEGTILFGGKGGYELRDYEPKARVLHIEQRLEDSDTTLSRIFTELAVGQVALSLAAFPTAQLAQPLNTLSGGERRRAFTAAGLYIASIDSYDVLCLDESVNGLDIAHTRELGRGLREFSQQHPEMIIVLASHDPLVHRMADYLVTW